MKIFAKIVVFSLIVIGAYWVFANKYIPPITPAPPPKEADLDLGSMSMEDFVAVGDEIFNGKGTCTLCHNPVVARAPLLENIAIIATDRLKDSRYKGKASNEAEYILESMTEPSAFVVIGFGVTGTNDTKSPMPQVSTGAIGLKDAEMKAVTAYLQDLAGVEITVEIPKGEAPGKEAVAEAPPPPAKTAEEAFAKYGCSGCHKTAPDGNNPGIAPDLTTTGKSKNADYVRKSILDPAAEIAKGFAPMMPAIYKDKMTAGEIELIVQYIMGSK